MWTKLQFLLGLKLFLCAVYISSSALSISFVTDPVLTTVSGIWGFQDLKRAFHRSGWISYGSQVNPVNPPAQIALVSSELKKKIGWHTYAQRLLSFIFCTIKALKVENKDLIRCFAKEDLLKISGFSMPFSPACYLLLFNAPFLQFFLLKWIIYLKYTHIYINMEREREENGVGEEEGEGESF